MNRRINNDRGYVLVLTLAVLMLAATALVSSGRLAVRHASRAREAERELQRRAGTTSCRGAILPQAERILEGQEVQRKSPLSRHRTAVRLGEFTFDLILADEQAKANVNALLERVAPDAVENRLRQALAGSGLLGAIELRPQRVEDRTIVTGLGQIFDDLDPQALLEPRWGGPAPLDWLTCWGSGAINVRRSSEQSLKLALAPPWTPLDVSRLIEARQEMFGSAGSIRAKRLAPAPNATPRDPLAQLLQNAQIRTGPAGLTLRSRCHSLWIITRDGRREWYDLAVEDASSERDGPRVITFSW
jgi:hypothetical protein